MKKRVITAEQREKMNAGRIRKALAKKGDSTALKQLGKVIKEGEMQTIATPLLGAALVRKPGPKALTKITQEIVLKDLGKKRKAAKTQMTKDKKTEKKAAIDKRKLERKTKAENKKIQRKAEVDKRKLERKARAEKKKNDYKEGVAKRKLEREAKRKLREGKKKK